MAILLCEGGDQCVSGARWDLRGGCRVTVIPPSEHPAVMHSAPRVALIEDSIN